MKTTLLLLSILFFASTTAHAFADYELQSPDGKLQIKIRVGERISYDVLVSGKPILANCTLSLDVDHQQLGLKPRVKSAKPGSVDRELTVVVPQKSAKVREHYQELRLDLEGAYAVI